MMPFSALKPFLRDTASKALGMRISLSPRSPSKDRRSCERHTAGEQGKEFQVGPTGLVPFLALAGLLLTASFAGFTPERVFYMRDFAAYNDFVHDDGAALAAAATAASNAGGGVVVLEQKAYWNSSTNLVFASNVELRCNGGFNRGAANGNSHQDYSSAPCTIYQASGKTLTIRGTARNVGIMTDAVHFTPQPTNSSTRAQITSFVSAFAGTGITIDQSNARLENVAIGGFAQCVSIGTASQVIMRDVLGDCTAGLNPTGSVDNNLGENIEFWPFLTANLTHSIDGWTISGLADNGSGLWRVTTSATNNLATGEQVWVSPNMLGGEGAGGLWTVTVIDSTHFDLQGSATAPTTTGNTTNGLTYVSGLASVANLQPGMGVSGTGIPTGAKIAAVWQSRKAISLDQSHAATATGTGVTLTFSSDAYSGTPGGVLVDEYWRSGTGFLMQRSDGMSCIACFDFGHQVGFNFNGGADNNFTAAQRELVTANSGSVGIAHLANQNAVPVAVEFIDGLIPSTKNFISGQSWSETGVVVLSEVGANERNTVQGFELQGASTVGNTLAEIGGAGTLTLLNVTDIANGPRTILIDNSATPIPTFLGNVTPNAIIYGTVATPLWTEQNIFGGINGTAYPPNFYTQQMTVQAPTNAILNLEAMAAGSNAKIWRLLGSSSGNWGLQTTDDAYTVANNSLIATRSGNSPTGQIPASSTVSTLPACNAGAKGTVVYVTDANSPTWNATLSGGGSTAVLGQCNGTNWTAH